MTETQANIIVVDFNRDHWSMEDVQFVRGLRAAGFSTMQIAAVIQEMGKVCHRCWNAEPGCQCSNDE